MARKIRLDQTVSWFAAVVGAATVYSLGYAYLRRHPSDEDADFKELVHQLQAKHQAEYAAWEQEQAKEDPKAGHGAKSGEESTPAEGDEPASEVEEDAAAPTSEDPATPPH